MISIIIPTYDKPELLKNCLTSLFDHISEDLEIIVVDNGSKDILVHPVIEKVIYLRLPQNEGFAKACNTGAKVAKNNFLLFLNNDTLAQNNFISPMLNAFKPGIGAVGNKLLYPDGNVQHAGIEFYLDMDGNLQGTNIRVDRPSGYVAAVTGACMAIRTHVFWEAKGFDEEYWNGNEDVDLCFRIRKNNWKIYFESDSLLTHFESQSGSERWSRVDQNVERLNKKWKQSISLPQ